jgi:hypothetical protein
LSLDPHAATPKARIARQTARVNLLRAMVGTDLLLLV